MRIWSLHPQHLDRAGLVACWRETLLAQSVLPGDTKGYRNHPQLVRFRAHAEPLAAVGTYLRGIALEADTRGYRFDKTKIRNEDVSIRLSVTSGQLEYEWAHLGRKLGARSPDDAARWHRDQPRPHPLFEVIPGPVEAWEKVDRPR